MGGEGFFMYLLLLSSVSLSIDMLHSKSVT